MATARPTRAAWPTCSSSARRRRAAAIRRRIKQLLGALGAPALSEDPPALLAALEKCVRDLGPHEAWLALAVLTARLPDVPTVQRVVRAARLDGALPAIYAGYA